MSGLTLYTAAQDVVDLLDAFDPETGEFPEGFEAALTQFKAKGQSVVAYLLNRDAEVEAIDGAIKRLQDRKKSLARRNDWLRDYLKDNMRAAGISELAAIDGSWKAKLQIGRDASVEVYEEGLLPPDYLREVPARLEADKKLIGAAIKDGHDVPGARIIKRDRLTIS
ncbi:siphovirus Gp157 family protein [Cupriavidus taiwanensis]|uniref:siphovirus Gp157 family protein n=1 Tax=Cupriavidus taiwanensis TaxID=164546 RepID=UPI000E194F42|nr:siphovirus Gp157 family protein [Cupriavidus taiwanensis]SPA44647.1 Siphovirus superfamily protein [Cupriavidus taiwanensis]